MADICSNWGTSPLSTAENGPMMKNNSEMVQDRMQITVIG